MEILICDYCQSRIEAKNGVYENSAFQNDEGLTMHKDCAKTYIKKKKDKFIVSPKTNFQPLYNILSN